MTVDKGQMTDKTHAFHCPLSPFNYPLSLGVPFLEVEQNCQFTNW